MLPTVNLQDINPVFTIAAFAVLVLVFFSLALWLILGIRSVLWRLRGRIEKGHPWLEMKGEPKMNGASESSVPTMPDSLKNMQIETLNINGLILHEFHAPLTIVQGAWMRDLGNIAWHCYFYDQLADRLGHHYVIDDDPRPLVRLHSDNVLLLTPQNAPAASNDHESLSKWLRRFDWSPDRLFSFQEAITAKPVEDGFLRCFRIIAGGGDHQTIEDDRLCWTASQQLHGPLIDKLRSFMNDEAKRANWPFSFENILHEWYKATPEEGKIHPGFAVLRQFDDGVTRMEYAGSIVSAAELRFWSRVVCYHK